MKNSQTRRFMTLFLVMVVALFALAACDAGNTDDDVGIVDDQTFGLYDTNDDQFLDDNEFNTFMADEGLDDDTWFNDYDTNTDTFLDENEFNTFAEDEGFLE